MPDPTPGPVHDPVRLGRIAWNAQNRYALTYGDGYGQQTPWDELEESVTDGLSDVATAVRDAVCPPSTHMVVRQAEYNALRSLAVGARLGADGMGDVRRALRWLDDLYAELDDGEIEAEAKEGT